MRQREDFDAILCATLSAGWSEQHRSEFSVTPGGHGRGELFRVSVLLSAYYPALLCPAGRRFLQDSFRYTARRSRAAPQFLLGTALGTAPALRWFGREGFRVRPELERVDELLVVPGNQRIRVFDFGSGRVRAWLKQGFEAASMRNEIAVRAGGARGPFIPIEAHSGDGRWFEEPIVDCWTLARCPPWISRASIEERAFELLDEWQTASRVSTNARDRAGELAERLLDLRARLEDRFGSACASFPARSIDELVNAASELGAISLAETHGDLQPGNVLIERRGRRVLLTDWEHRARRMADYDLLVYGLRSRGTPGLGERLRAFGSGVRLPRPLDTLPRDSGWRRAVLAMFTLEELVWFHAESLSGPYRTVPRGLRNLELQLSRSR